MRSKITPCLWFDGQAEEAAGFYTGIFPNSRIISISRYSDAGTEAHGHQAGKVMVVAFELDGQSFTALNGGPQFRFNEAISLQIDCATQEEIEHYWQHLSAVPEAEQCGWLKDRYGVSWQMVPAILPELLADAESSGTRRAMAALLRMKKPDIAVLRRAFEGKA